MAYVGRGIDNISNASLLDTITFTNSAGPYNLEKGSAAFTPISVQALVISVDGVIQAPDSYTISAATITFGVSMASTLTNDFIVHNGVGLFTTPAVSVVTAAKLATTGSASSSTYLRGDNAWGAISTPITALNNATANELVTVGSTTTELDAESGLTFDGNTLTASSTSAIQATFTGYADTGANAANGKIVFTTSFFFHLSKKELTFV